MYYICIYIRMYIYMYITYIIYQYIAAKVPGSTDLQLQLCVDTIEWCKQEKRSFLRHRIQVLAYINAYIYICMHSVHATSV
jgi:hypothetical protein